MNQNYSQIYHVLSRGTDKRKIFMDDRDRFRFIHDLFEFNNQELSSNLNYFFRKHHNNPKSMDVGHRYIGGAPRKLIVDLHAFCLMGNHYHLLVSPRIEKGISLFMKKLNGGYAKYFNQKYERTGTLFESKYKRIQILDHSHFLHIPYYIHLNPLDLSHPEWRDSELKNPESALKFLASYRWSSHLDYLGQHNFPSVTQRDLLLSFWGGAKEYEKDLKQWLHNISIEKIKEVALE